MKTLIKAALAATVATGLFAAPALAANTATAPFTAYAKIVKPLTLVKKDDLDFGTITLGTALTSSDVVVARDGGTSTCGTNLVCTTPMPASFNATGVALQGLTVSVNMATSPGKLLDSLGNSVDFVIDAPTSISLDSAGKDYFEIGGTITVKSSTVDGSYENDVDVTVEYS